MVVKKYELTCSLRKNHPNKAANNGVIKPANDKKVAE